MGMVGSLDFRVVASVAKTGSRLGWSALFVFISSRIGDSLDDGPRMALLLGRNAYDCNGVVGFGHSIVANQR